MMQKHVKAVERKVEVESAGTKRSDATSLINLTKNLSLSVAGP